MKREDSGSSIGLAASSALGAIAAWQEKVVPFASISMDPGADSFSFHGEDGIVAHIPLHRVRTVYKDGAVIWQRPGHPQS